ncbi:ESCRT-0 subunit protein hse1 [Myotisia sp. PD_48]|nr:ESCRT-0 subunit protein hse1 [Myotisia sp. PD_48]
MFRAQQNAFDDVVAKATDENLTSENWEYILDVCDKVAADSTGAKDAVAAMIRRLAHRNANVQLYTLELANALSQNCGARIHQELASKSFTDSLLRLANDRNTHQQVKSKILVQLEEWTEMFSSNSDLGIMEQAYMKLKAQNPEILPPSKPTKREITDQDRQKEEDELQMALALSIREKPQANNNTNTNNNNNNSEATDSSKNQTASAAPPGQAIQTGTTAATVSRVRALYDFQPSEAGELQFRKGDVIAVLKTVYKDWWQGSLRGQVGIFPLNYVEKLSDPTAEELQREAQMEAEVFGEIKNVEKLLALLSTSNSELNVQENEEITTLYHSTLAIRPKLIELIGKYSKKKDDFTQLNEKFIKARRDYETLLETSMAQPQPQYGRPPQAAYGYPPPGGQQQYPPTAAQQDPQRFYATHPQHAQTSPPNGPAGYHGGEQNVPYPMTPHSPDIRKHTPVGAIAAVAAHQVPDSYNSNANASSQYNQQAKFDHPHELGTSAYDSPQETTVPNVRHSYQPPMQQPPAGPPQQQQQQPSGYPPQLPSSSSVVPGASSHTPPPQTQYPQPPTQGSYQQLPTHQPPPIPTSASPQPPYPNYSAPTAPSAPDNRTYTAYTAPQSTSPNANADPAAYYLR